MKKIIFEILKELKKNLEKINVKKTKKLVNEILKAKRIFLVGSGRSGLIAAAFGTRLIQLGIPTFIVGEPTTPGIKKDDLLIAVSGSGETETVYDIVQEAKKKKVKVFCITAKKSSRIAKKADFVVLIPAKTKFDKKESLQPLGSPFEQAALIYLDATIILLMKKLKKNEPELKKEHTTLE